MRRIIFVSTIAVLAGWGWGQTEFLSAQRQPPVLPFGAPADDEAALDELESKPLFLSDRELAMRLSRARRAVEAGDHSTAITHLQTVLNSDEDYFVNVGDQRRPEYRSLKQEAQRLVLELPEQGRKSYELQFGIEAQRTLDEAVGKGDLGGIEAVARRFFHTKAGYEAVYRLGTNHLNRAQPLSAALYFERLRETPGAARGLEPMLSLKTAVSWGRAGLPERSRRTLLEFKQVLDRDHVVLGGQRVKLFENDDEALDWLVSVLGEQSEFAAIAEESWTMFGGNASRNALSSVSSPVWDRQWQYPTVGPARSNAVNGSNNANHSNDSNGRAAAAAGSDDGHTPRALAALLEEDEQTRRDGNLIGVPAGQPLVVGQTVVVRTLKNLRAVDLRSGRFLWRSIVDDEMYEKLTQAGNKVPQTGGGYAQTRMQSPVKMFLTQRTWRDLTTGTLSSDGRRIFAVEESGFVGPYHIIGRGGPHPLAPKEANKLLAYETDGRLIWEVGGSRGDVELDLAGAFFLGPPLPLNDRIYCLAEVGGEIRLLVLDPAEQGRLLWSQSLILPDLPLMQHPFRRTSGLSPSYSDGILVCPTVSGALMAVDLSRRMLLWNYQYDDNMPKPPQDRRARMRFQMQMMHQGGSNDSDEDRWLDSNPRIAERRVIVTPPDSDELHCLNLIDGTPIWTRPRGEGLYVAAVHDGKVVVVERTGVRAYSLADGAEVWDEPTPIPIPSGRGVQMGGRYLIPLTTAEVATIDLQSGRILARSKSREGHAPGNLVSAGGVLISQSAHEVSGYQALDALEQQFAEKLKSDPEDADVFALRGEMLLHQGREEQGLADLRRAVDLAGQPRARETIVSTLLEGLRMEFATYSKQARELEELIDDPQQRTGYLRLYATGLQRTGQRQEAFAAYLKLAGPDAETAGMEPLEGTLSVRSDRWVRARIAELYAESNADERAAMQESLESQLDVAIRSDRIEPLQKFLEYFETQPIAQRARLALVRSFDPRTHTLEIERHLRRLVEADDDELAAYATARLCQLLIDSERPGEARELAQRLASEFADTPCLDDKTGRELADEWRADEYVAGQWADERPWPKHVQVEDAGQGQMLAQFMPIEIAGARGGPLAGWSLEMDQQRQHVIARDGRGNPRWQFPLGDKPSQHHQGNYARIAGHVIVVALGNHFLVLDALDQSRPPKLLWKRDLFESMSGERPPVAGQIQRVPGPQGPRFVLRDPYGKPMGTVGVVTEEVVCYQVGMQLYAADTLTGDVLWERRSIARDSEIFGDGRFVFVVAPNSNQARVLRTEDGRHVAATRIPPGGQRLGVQGTHLLSFGPQGDGQALSCLDLTSGETCWQREYSEEAQTFFIQDDGVAVFEPDGRFELVGWNDGRPRLKADLPPEPDLDNILVVQNQQRTILLVNKPHQTETVFRVQGTGVNQPVVNGTAYAFDRESGRKLWEAEIENQALDLSQPLDLPVLTFTAQVDERMQSQGPRPINPNRFALLVLDTRTGNVLHETRQRDLLRGLQVTGRRDRSKIEIGSSRTRLLLHYSDDPPANDDEEKEQDSDAPDVEDD